MSTPMVNRAAERISTPQSSIAHLKATRQLIPDGNQIYSYSSGYFKK